MVAEVIIISDWTVFIMKQMHLWSKQSILMKFFTCNFSFQSSLLKQLIFSEKFFQIILFRSMTPFLHIYFKEILSI